MFITKPNIAEKWFSDLFTWLFKCEKIFGFENLKGYETTRLYAYLAERYLSFWFTNIQNIKIYHGFFVICLKNKVSIFYDQKINF